MDAHYSVELPQAFVAGENELKKLGDLLSNRVGELEIRANCADEISRTFSSVRELLAYDNVKDSEVRSLRISARSEDFKKRATVELAGTSWRQISLDFQGRDDVVSRLRTEVLTILATMRPWYSAFHRIDFLGICLTAFVLLWLTLWLTSSLVIAMKWVRVDDSKPVSTSAIAWAQVVVYGGMIVALATAYALNRFRDSLFPRAVFLIGHAKDRYKHLERVQWGVVISFIVSLVASLVIIVIEAVWS